MSESAASPVEQKILVRHAETSKDLQTCVELQQVVWGYSAIDTVPDQIFVVARKTGGQVLLARDGDEPVGFALAFMALREGFAYLHSHMVGVLKSHRDRGVGRALKLEQRNDAIARKIALIEWTFDPLQLKNAHFNIARLGAIVRRYIPNLYGRTTSPLHAGLPTDRLVAEWWVRSARVRNITVERPRYNSSKTERISVPTDIGKLCQSQPEIAEKTQSDIRARFEELFAKGYAATGFEIAGDHAEYLLEPYED